jgi:hypothetical protein
VAFLLGLLTKPERLRAREIISSAWEKPGPSGLLQTCILSLEELSC